MTVDPWRVVFSALVETASRCAPRPFAVWGTEGDINTRRVVKDEAARGTPADARLVPELGVVYGADIPLQIIVRCYILC